MQSYACKFLDSHWAHHKTGDPLGHAKNSRVEKGGKNDKFLN